MTQSLEELLQTQVARWSERVADWEAFADAKGRGCRRSPRRSFAPGPSGRSAGRYIPAEHFTLSVMFVPPGQGNAAHSHEVEEAFFILEGKVKVFFQDAAGRGGGTVLGPW